MRSRRFSARCSSGSATSFQETLLWMIGLQSASGVALAFLAAIQVRPIFKRQDGAVARPRGLRAILAARRLRSHRPLGDRPMLWKELHTGGARGFARIVGWLLTLVLGGLLLYYGGWYGLMAFLERWDGGNGAGWGWCEPARHAGNSSTSSRWCSPWSTCSGP